MSCECHDTKAAHDEWAAADEAHARVVFLPQYEAERRYGYLYHCPECTREARGPLAAEQCVLCPPGRHRVCEFHE